ncbi:hypothetical protein BXT84_08440 [Sulfobacillus thermotolerans]|uniref:YfhO family protein n=1 Tax=Sulfobacillus thermotolerans TaxID=338644 RepID=A0ABN5GZX1_9FIRM|nr:hypothetical protein BXT84_08440 [Sulfobacillus thermotolerans]
MISSPIRSQRVWDRKDIWALAFLVGFPMLVAVSLKPGLLTLHGDNLIQNYPLRILVGKILREGHLPLWDPYIWSGTPLLAGFNAGAAYPLTWLFALLSGPWAWTLTIGISYAVASTGFYTFLRVLGRSVWASLLGSWAFAFGGFMAAQMVHLETLQGVGWLTWVAVALYQIAHASTPRMKWAWVLALGVFAGAVILVGSPEPMAYGAIFSAILAAFFVTSTAYKGATMAGYGVAAAIALLLGAAQWVPGEAFIHLSQRSHASFQFFGSMSVPPADAVLLFFPYILGGYHRFLAMMYYAGRFNLPEVSSYVGILPLYAAVRMFPVWAPPAVRRLVTMFYTLAIVGAVLALGKYTPLSHLLFHVPVYNGIRAQNRNLFMLDFALAALFALWIDNVRDTAFAADRQRLTKVFGVVLASVFAWGLWEATSRLFSFMVPYLIVSVLLGAAAVAVIIGLPRVPERWRIGILALFTAVDLGLYDAGQYWLNVPKPSVATGTGYLVAKARAEVPVRTRYALYNPDLNDYRQVDAIGQPDLNILTGLPSFQGYGSLVSSRYNNATGAHLQATFSPTVLNLPLINQLNVSTLFTVPSSFIQRVPLSWHPRTHVAEPLATAEKPWFFGKMLDVTALHLDMVKPLTASKGRWRVGLVVSGSDKEKWLTPQVRFSGQTVTLSWPATPMAGLAIHSPGHRPIDGAMIVTSEGKAYRITGPLQNMIAFPKWRFVGTIGAFGVFRNTKTQGMVWLTGPGKAEIVHQTLQAQDTVVVSAPRATTLIRSEAYQPGWTATITGPHLDKTERVEPEGVIQAVAIPKGRYQVIFRYRPRSVRIGLWGSGVGIAVVVLGALTLWATRRRNMSRTMI